MKFKETGQICTKGHFSQKVKIKNNRIKNKKMY